MTGSTNARIGLSLAEFQAMAAACDNKALPTSQDNLLRAALNLCASCGRICEKIADIAPGEPCDAPCVTLLTREIGESLSQLALAAEHLGTPLETCGRTYLERQQKQPAPVLADQAVKNRQLADDLATLRGASAQPLEPPRPTTIAPETDRSWTEVASGPMINRGPGRGMTVALAVGVTAFVAVGWAFWHHPTGTLHLLASVQDLLRAATQ